MELTAPPLLVSRATLRTEGYALLYPTSYQDLQRLQAADIVVMWSPAAHDMSRGRGGPIGYASSDDLRKLAHRGLPQHDFDPTAGPEDRRLAQVLARLDYCASLRAALPVPDPAERHVNLDAEAELLTAVARALAPKALTPVLATHAAERVRALPAPTHAIQ